MYPTLNIAKINNVIHNGFVDGMRGHWPTLKDDDDGRAVAMLVAYMVAGKLIAEQLVHPVVDFNMSKEEKAIGLSLTFWPLGSDPTKVNGVRTDILLSTDYVAPVADKTV